MAHAIWFRTPLTCLSCGSPVEARDTRLHTSSLDPEPLDRWVEPGEVLALDVDDFADGYHTLRLPGDDPDVRALEQWSCPVCGEAQWARLDFHREGPGRYRFVSAHAVPLTPEVLGEAHFLSRRIDQWLESDPGAGADRIRPLVAHLLPPR